MTKALKTQAEKSVGTQIANLMALPRPASIDPTPTPPCPAQPRPPAGPGGHPPRLAPIPVAPTPFREIGAAFGFGVSREFRTAPNGVGGGCCYGA